MLLPFSSSELAEAVATKAVVRERREAWSAAVDWLGGVPERQTPRIYDAYPLLFAPAFPGIERTQLADLVVAGKLLSDSILAFDAVVDERMDSGRRAADVARGQSMQLEAHWILAKLFPAESSFWISLRADYLEYLAAMQAERALAVDKLDEQALVDVARGKTAVARSCLSAMGILSGCPGVAADLSIALTDFYLARQMWDDLMDWREDLASGQQTLLLARALHELRGEAREPHTVGVAIYFNGHADHVLAIGERALTRARCVVARVGVAMAFGRLLDQLAEGLDETRRDLAAIVKRKQSRPGARPHALPTRPQRASVASEVLWSAAEALSIEAPRAFGEARHWMKFPKEMGLESALTQSGDVFQRAVIADALCDLPPALLASFAPVLDHELDYLLASRVSALCGWGYLPELAELSADADTLAQVLQVATRRGRARPEDFDPPIELLLNSSHADGSFVTWIIPPEEQRDAVHRRQAHYAEVAWGTGPDPEVMANLLYALTLWDRQRFAVAVSRGSEYLIARQHPSGHWMSSWYHGPFYGTYVVTRLLGTVGTPSANAAVARAAEALVAAQRGDGSWSEVGDGRALDTAHAILTLAFAFRIEPSDDIRRSVIGGIEALRALRVAAGAWAADELIRMDCGRASGTPGRVLTFGSRTLTTAFVLKAAVAASLLQEITP